MHKDQFTATGPAFNESGFPRAAFSNNSNTDFDHGVNVKAKRCGVYGQSVNVDLDRHSSVDGIGVEGVGENFGVYGNGNRGIAGVFGHHNKGGAGVLGAAMRRGTGLIGLSVKNLGNPLTAFRPSPDPADGTGTGVYGSSGSGSGVRGTSDTGNGGEFKSNAGAGASGESQAGDGVVGLSHISDKSGVFGFNTSEVGIAFGVFGRCESAQGVGVAGNSTNGDGVSGLSKGTDKSGVFGWNQAEEGRAFGVFGRCDSAQGVGVAGTNERGVGVSGTSDGDNGVVGHAQADRTSGVFGENTGAHPPTPPFVEPEVYGVHGRANARGGIGVFGESEPGIGVRGNGGMYGATFSGRLAPLRLVPASISGPPTAGGHLIGELYVDKDGNLFFCKVSGTPGTWVRIA